MPLKVLRLTKQIAPCARRQTKKQHFSLEAYSYTLALSQAQYPTKRQT
jgi:hypothetical protein